MSNLASSPTVTGSYSNYWYSSLQSETVKRQPALIVPGLNNSDETHWQSLWHKELDGSQRIQLANWHLADLDKWRRAIKKSLAQFDQPVVVIGHSFGALAAATVAAELPEKIAGLFLVAPADPDKFGVSEVLPQRPVKIPGVLISSDNDPWIKDSQAAYLALLWGIDFLRVKDLGHINSHSAIGIWPEGLRQYERLVERVTSTRSSSYL